MAEQIDENFDLSELKVVDESGETQDVVLEQPKEESPETEEVKGETEVENTSEEKTEVEETTEEPVAEEEVAEEITPDSEEESEEGDKKIGKPEELFNQLDSISKELSEGRAETLEDFFEDYKRMRDSGGTQYKDDYIKSAVDYYNKNGSLTPYLEATSVNYEEMTDEQVMRRNLINEHPTLSQKAIERLYNRDIVNKYSLDEDKFDEEEVELGKELLNADASKLRNKFVDEQKNFTAPPKSDSEPEVDQNAINEEWAKTVTSHDTTKDILDNKRILVEHNGEKFSYEVEDPKQLEEMTKDNNKFFELFKDGDGEIDFSKWYRVLAYATDPDVYDSSLISHGQELGQEKVVSDLKNPSKPRKASQGYKEPSSPLEGLIGALSRGDSDVKIIR